MTSVSWQIAFASLVGQPSKNIELIMRARCFFLWFLNVILAAALAGGVVLEPVRGGAESQDMVALQQSVRRVIKEQKDTQTAVTQGYAEQKTLLELCLDSTNKIKQPIGELEAHFRTSSQAPYDNEVRQVSSAGDNLRDLLAAVNTLQQQVTSTQNILEKISAELPSRAAGSGARHPSRKAK